MEIKELFIRQMQELFPDSYAEILEAIGEEPSVSVRTNPDKYTCTPAGSTVPWCTYGFYLSNRPAFTFDPMLHAGAYYVQDASSMFITHIIKHIASESPIAYLDLCAAPGGKTTAALDCIGKDSLMVCNEIDPQRAQILCENVVKWGRPNCVVTNDTPKNLGKLKGFFDIIAADMPCSGEGMFRKDDDAVDQWSPALVDQCANRQKEIADHIWKALKPGGYLIYSTCTFNRRENEEIVEYLLETYDAESVEIPVAQEWGIAGGCRTENHCYRFMPHRVKGEGLFMSVVRKINATESLSHDKPKKGKNKPHKQGSSIPSQCKQLISGEMKWSCSDDRIQAMPEPIAGKMEKVASSAKTLLCGIEVARIKGKDIVPCHSAALSTCLNRKSVTTVEVPYSDAIAYLRGEPIQLPDSAPRGHVLVCYRSLPLGWLKNLGNRTNNCYPKEWRIRSAFVPPTPPEILTKQ